MEKIKITFWKESYNPETSFIKEINNFLTSAEVTKTTNGNEDNYTVKFVDIGLDSLYGQLIIKRRAGNWITSSEDSAEINLLKWNIIGAIMLQP
ncbi:MAG: hypothetical protein QM710_14225 [Flavobacterium sp.]